MLERVRAWQLWPRWRLVVAVATLTAIFAVCPVAVTAQQAGQQPVPQQQQPVPQQQQPAYQQQQQPAHQQQQPAHQQQQPAYQQQAAQPPPPPPPPQQQQQQPPQPPPPPPQQPVPQQQQQQMAADPVLAQRVAVHPPPPPPQNPPQPQYVPQPVQPQPVQQPPQPVQPQPVQPQPVRPAQQQQQQPPQQQQQQQQPPQHQPPQHQPPQHQPPQHQQQQPPQQQPPVPPGSAADAARTIGPVRDLDLPPEEWRKAHHEDHLFGDDSDEFESYSGGTIFREWEEHMDDFTPDMLVNFDLSARSDEYFYQDMDDTKTLIRGGYFVSGEGAIDFVVTNPKGEIIVSKSEPESLFYFETSAKGTYTFILSNHKWVEHRQVTFAIGSGNDTAALLSHNVDDAMAHVHQVDRMIRDIQSETQYLWSRQIGHMKVVQHTLSRVFWFASLELLSLVVIWSLQIYYIKNLVSDRRMF